MCGVMAVTLESRLQIAALPDSYTLEKMAQAVKKKLVICGGNGFLGEFNPNSPSSWCLELQTDLTQARAFARRLPTAAGP